MSGLKIVWNLSWEDDKGPDVLLEIIDGLLKSARNSVSVYQSLVGWRIRAMCVIGRIILKSWEVMISCFLLSAMSFRGSESTKRCCEGADRLFQMQLSG